MLPFLCAVSFQAREREREEAEAHRLRAVARAHRADQGASSSSSSSSSSSAAAVTLASGFSGKRAAFGRFLELLARASDQSAAGAGGAFLDEVRGERLPDMGAI
jgi:hypothetical protein